MAMDMGEQPELLTSGQILLSIEVLACQVALLYLAAVPIKVAPSR